MSMFLKTNKLIIVSKAILEFYYQLINLEIENKKDTEEYDKILNHVKELTESEDKLLSELTPNEWILYTEEFSDRIVERNASIEDNIDIILTDDKTLQAYQRLIKKLKSKSLQDLSTPLENANPEDYFCDSLEELKSIKRIVEGTSKIYLTLHEDAAFLLVNLLDKRITEEENQSLKEALIKIKYKFIYTYPTLEPRFIGSKFNVTGEIYFSSDLVASFYKVSEISLNYLKSDFAKQILSETIAMLLRIKNEDFDYKYLEVIIRELFLRVSFQLLDEEQISDFHKNYKSDLESELIGCERSIETFENAFKSYKKDKALINKVTLG